MSYEYCDGSLIGNPVAQAIYLKETLSLLGFNHMMAPLKGYTGNVLSPTFTQVGDERSGWYSLAPGNWGLSLFGFLSYSYETGRYRVYDTYGRHVEFNLPTLTSNYSQTFKAASGTIALEETSTWKNYARAATTDNITLSGSQTIDGVTLINNDRVLVWKQTDASENGVYSYNSSGSWARASDMDTTTLLTGAVVVVVSGDDNKSKIFTQQTYQPNIGVDDIVWSEISGSGSGGGFGDYVTYANSSTTDLAVDLDTFKGWILFKDDQYGYCYLRTDDWVMERGSYEYIAAPGLDPTSSQINIVKNISTNQIQIKVGSSAGRNISYKLEGVLL